MDGENAGFAGAKTCLAFFALENYLGHKKRS